MSTNQVGSFTDFQVKNQAMLFRGVLESIYKPYTYIIATLCVRTD